ncbi:MAG: glycosyl hydrolase [Fimbriimonas sp.]|nr:glycosyl hydrolase [Fimbriimonas sp.]
MKTITTTLLLLPLSTCQANLPPTWLPADRHADRCVRELLVRLRNESGHHMFSGQTDLGDAEWVERQTGKAPVILALDFMSTPKSMGGDTSNTSVAIDWSRKRNGIVAYQWHWSSPTGAKDRNKGFYTNSTTFDLASVLANRKSSDYAAMLADIDDIAAQIQKLRDANVPVLFRPLHEAQGGWFWWGSKGPKACVELYKLIFHRMTGVHRLHNIAWVWNVYPASQNKGNPDDWYPGNDLVDVVATDYLQGKRDYDDLVRLTGGKKLVAIAETMNPPSAQQCFADGAPWAYWVTWARRDWNKNSVTDVVAAMKDPLTLTSR